MKKVKKVANGVKVETVALDARQLITIDVGHLFWTKGVTVLKKTLGDSKGAIVRVRPPATSTDADEDLLARWFADIGAVKVRIESRAQADALAEEETPLSVSHTDRREAVMVMADKSQQKDALKEVLDSYLVMVKL